MGNWEAESKFVLEMLHSLVESNERTVEAQAETQKTLCDIQIGIEQLRTKAALAGLFAGSIPGIITLVVLLLRK